MHASVNLRRAEDVFIMAMENNNRNQTSSESVCSKWLDVLSSVSKNVNVDGLNIFYVLVMHNSSRNHTTSDNRSRTRS